MDDILRVGLYARVSSQRQTDEATIGSQVAALENRIRADGHHLEPELRFLDDGVSGGTLVRPALERLRDLVYLGGVDCLYVHSPDRLARKFVYQAVLLEEFAKHQVTVIFLNQPVSDASPEGNLLVQMQGMFAEYERAKILERTRRGRRHHARQGQVSALGHAPYGYRYVPKQQGDGEARYDLVPEEARVVREMFHWVGVEGLSLGGVVRRLTEQNVPTRSGGTRWNPANAVHQRCRSCRPGG
jgi:site-specific DNA recombinase